MWRPVYLDDVVVLHSCENGNLLADSSQHGIVYPAVAHYPGLTNELHYHLQDHVIKSLKLLLIEERNDSGLMKIQPHFLPITAPYCLPDEPKSSFTHSFNGLILFFKLPVTGSRLLEVHGRT